MDGAPKAGGGGGKAALPVSPGGSDANVGAARAARQAPLLVDDAANAATDALPPAAAAVGGGRGGDGDDDEQQVERFYALLDNIRAMRGAYGAVEGDGAADGVETGGGGAGRKRQRAAEPPWRPAFRLEDFEEPSPTSSDDAAQRAKRTPHRQGQGADAEKGGAGARWSERAFDLMTCWGRDHAGDLP